MSHDNAPLRAAVIGCGAISSAHLDYLASPGDYARLVAVCDRSRALAEAAALRYPQAEVFVDAEAMLADVRPDVVHVLTPPQTHDTLVRAALAAGAHVVCEKPMTGTAAETEALLDAASQAGRVLVESRNLLFTRPVIALMDAIAAGRLGEVRECDVLLQLDFLAGPFGDRNLEGPGVALPGGAIHDFLPHLVYLFETLGGAHEVKDVCGALTNRSTNPRAGYDFLDALIDAGAVSGRLRIATDIAPPAFRIAVRGTLASAETDLYNPWAGFSGPPYTGKAAPIGQLREGLRMMRAGLGNLRDKIGQRGTDYGMGPMLDAIYAALRTGAPVPIRPADILSSARLTDRLVALGKRT